MRGLDYMISTYEKSSTDTKVPDFKIVKYLETPESVWKYYVLIEWIETPVNGKHEKIAWLALKKHMQDLFGVDKIRWNILWTLYGASINFQNENDLAVFLFLHS